MLEKVQLISDLRGVIRVARANNTLVDIGTLVGSFWGLSSVAFLLFEAAVDMVPDDDTLLRVSGTTMQFLDSATGTVEYATLEVPDFGA